MLRFTVRIKRTYLFFELSFSQFSLRQEVILVQLLSSRWICHTFTIFFFLLNWSASLLLLKINLVDIRMGHMGPEALGILGNFVEDDSFDDIQLLGSCQAVEHTLVVALDTAVVPDKRSVVERQASALVALVKSELKDKNRKLRFLTFCFYINIYLSYFALAAVVAAYSLVACGHLNRKIVEIKFIFYLFRLITSPKKTFYSLSC